MQEYLWAAYQADTVDSQISSLEKAGLFCQNLIQVFQYENSILFQHADISMPYLMVFAELHTCIN